MDTSTFGPVTRDSASVEFFDAAARGQLLAPKCITCDAWQPLTTHICISCGTASLSWLPTGGRGSVVTWTVLTDPTAGDARVMVIVELDEGPWLETRLVGVAASDVRQGMAVTIGFVTPQDSEAMPVAHA